MALFVYGVQYHCLRTWIGHGFGIVVEEFRTSQGRVRMAGLNRVHLVHRGKENAVRARGTRESESRRAVNITMDRQPLTI